MHCALHAKFVLKEGDTRRQRSACFEFKASQSASECCRTCRPNLVRMELKRGQRSRGREHPTQGRSPVVADLIVENVEVRLSETGAVIREGQKQARRSLPHRIGLYPLCANTVSGRGCRRDGLRQG